MCNDPLYYLFAGDDYYPRGGVADFRGRFMSVADAVNEGKNHEWWHVTDDHLKIVSEG